MNQAQRAFTYVDTFAREIRDITENRFFLDIYTCNRNDKKNGTLERIVGDMVILCSYPDQYRKDSKSAFKAFTESGMEDTAFGKFLEWFVNGGSETEMDGKSWDMLDTSHSTRDTGTVYGKIDYLAALIEKYVDRFQKAA